jgi:hypothetical protein
MPDAGDNLSKEYVEHLRTVHFSLIALCLGAIVLAFTPDTSEIQQARREIAALLRLKAAWERDPNWIQSAAAAKVSAWEATYGDAASKESTIFPEAQSKEAVFTWGTDRQMDAMKNGGGTTFFVDESGRQQSMSSGDYMERQRLRNRRIVTFDQPNWIVAGPSRACADNDQGPQLEELFYQQQIVIHAPAKLEDFRSCWTLLAGEHNILIPEHVSETVYLLSDTPKRIREWGSLKWFAPGQIVPPLELFPSIHPILTPGDIPARIETTSSEKTQEKHEARLLIGKAEATAALHLGNIGKVDANYIWIEGNDVYVIPVTESGQVGFQPIKELLDHFDEKELPAGKFATSFPNLDSLAEIYGDFDVDKLDGILKDLQNRTGGESFQVFGVRIPAGATSRWGVMVVLSVQLYFWMHLGELRRRLRPTDAGWNVAFIGMYSSLPACVVYFVTSCVLPLLAIVALCVKGILAGENRALVINVLLLGSIAALALTIGIWKASPRRTLST